MKTTDLYQQWAPWIATESYCMSIFMNMDLFCARHNDKIRFNKRKRIQGDAKPTIYNVLELLMVFLPLRELNRELSIATGSVWSYNPISPSQLPHFYDSIPAQQLKLPKWHYYNNFTCAQLCPNYKNRTRIAALTFLNV